MTCARCHSENPAEHTFCHACGASLTYATHATFATTAAATSAKVCPSCGVGQSPLDRFCASCGQDFSASVTRTVRPALDPTWLGPAEQAPALDRGLPEPESLRCPQCGLANDARSLGCRRCDARLTPSLELASDQPAIDLNPQAFVVVILRDGTDGGVYPVIQERTDIGSREGDIVLKEDPYLSPRHARIERRGERFVLMDLASLNGIYLRLREPTILAHGDMLLLGQQVLRFEVPSEVERHVGPALQHGVMIFGTPEQPRLARLVVYTTEGLPRDVYYLQRSETVFGREAADLTFSDDPFLSRRHAAIVVEPHEGKYILRDLGSSNGTALRCRSEHNLVSGDQFRLGRHLFRFDLGTAGDDGGGQGLS